MYVCMDVCRFDVLEVDEKFLKRVGVHFFLGCPLEFISQLDRSWGALARNHVL